MAINPRLVYRAAAVASVPQGYARVGHRDTGFTLANNLAAGDDVPETVMFTAEGGIYSKK